MVHSQKEMRDDTASEKVDSVDDRPKSLLVMWVLVVTWWALWTAAVAFRL